MTRIRAKQRAFKERVANIQEKFRKEFGIHISESQAILAGLSKMGDVTEFTILGRNGKKKKVKVKRTR